MVIGQTVGKYVIVDTLGTGGMGTVYRAFDRTLERTVALKIVHLDPVPGVTPDELAKRFRIEALAGARLNHPAIVAIYDYDDQDPIGAYIAMEYVEGCGLDQYLKQRTELHLEDAISAMQQVLDGLACAHRQGVVHRDIKPANLLITRDGLVKIMDFGIAKMGLRTQTQSGLIMGTPQYMAPEQYVGGTVDQRCDIHAAGAVLYELLTGAPPYIGTEPEVMYKICRENPKPLSNVDPSIAKAFDPIVAKALEKVPANRYASAEDFQEALRSSWQDISSKVPSPTLSEGARTIATASSLQRVSPLGNLQVADTIIRAPTAGVTGAAPVAGPVAQPVPPDSVAPLAASPRPDTISKTAAATGSKRGAGATGSLLGWSRDQLAEVERQLTPIVGPMARILVREAAATTGNRQELYRLLATHLRTPEERRQFQPAGDSSPTATGSTKSPTTALGSTMPPSVADTVVSSSAAGVPLTAQVTQRASQLLARYLGPIATVVTRRAAQTAADEAHLYAILAEKLTDTAERERFLLEARRQQ
jgi:serine/threonine protein kinase